MAGKCELIIKIESKKEGISVESFRSTFEGTIEALQGIDDLLSPGKKKLGLDIKRININSPGNIVLTENDTTESDYARIVFDKLGNDLRTIDEKEEFPEDINHKTREGYDKIFNSIRNGVKSFSIISPGLEERIYSDSFIEKFSKAIKFEKDQSYIEWSTIEGVLLYLNLHSQPMSFRLYDQLIRRYLKCEFGETHKKLAKEAIEKRVSVHGKTEFNRFRQPMNMSVESIEIYPEINEIPKYKDLPVLDITDGLNSYDFVRRMRDAS